MRNGAAIANGTRQFAITVPAGAWVQVESATGNAVAANGLATAPARRWRGQMGAGENVYDYVQGLLIQNRDATATLYATTTQESDGAAPTRSVAYAIAIAPGASLKLDNTDASKVYLQSSSGSIIAAILAT
jgi:hypothetical protein